jgi:uncharacterized protein YlxW (UPF0749 family)
MSLLTEIVRHPLDPEYAAVAARHQGRRGRPSGPATRAVMVVVLAAIGLLTVAAVLALRTPPTGQTSARKALLQRIQAETAAADRLQASNTSLRLSNDRAQAARLRLGSQSRLADQIQLLGVLSGSLAVQGPGLRISVNDAPTSSPTADADAHQQAAADQGRVQDRDLQTVVNGLWAAGAEAISINGQRLTALSAIRSAGQAILVDFRPLSPPYVISVVGDPDPMQALFANGSGGRYLRSLSDNFQIPSTISRETSLTLPASSGLTLHEAVPAPTPTRTEKPS